MKAVILARVSTKDQEEGHSLDAQIANLELYAKRKNLTIIRRFTIIESSTKGERPEFEQMIEFIKGQKQKIALIVDTCLLYTSTSPRDRTRSRMPSSA